MSIILNDENYIAKVYNPNRMRSYADICELEEIRRIYNWSIEDFNLYII